MKVLFATRNKGKMKEIRAILNADQYEVYSLDDLCIETQIEENGKTFEENALIKAREISKNWDGLVLADDSGLEIDALNKEPGVYSARYMGEDTSYHIKNANLIERMHSVEFEKRTARFVCAIAAVFSTGEELVVRETIEGFIGYKEQGENGFGYDPIFILDKDGLSTAELSMEEKNRISHRGKALKRIKEELEKRNSL